MNWNFTGEVSSKRLLPARSGRYQINLNSWSFSNTLSSSLRSRLDGARKTAEIMGLSEARDILLNLQDLGKALSDNSTNSSELSYLSYWRDHSGQLDNLFSVVIGLNAEALDEISTTLDRALFGKNPVHIFCVGGFSAIENNPRSIQPTYERFELGGVLPLTQQAQLTVHTREAP